MTNIKDIVKGKNAQFVFFRDQAQFYETDDGFQFPVPVEDAGSATFNSEEKAILLMRYIRKHPAKTEKALEEQAGSGANGTYLSQNVGWVSVFCVTHQALRGNTTPILMSAWRHLWWVTAQTACLTHPTWITEPLK